MKCCTENHQRERGSGPPGTGLRDRSHVLLRMFWLSAKADISPATVPVATEVAAGEM